MMIIILCVTAATLPLDCSLQVSFISAMGLPLAGAPGRCCSDRSLHDKSLTAFCMSPCGTVMITSGKNRFAVRV